MASSNKVFENNDKWKKEMEKNLEKAGFSHIEGTRIICQDCGCVPRLDSGDDPFVLHSELNKKCKFVQEELKKRYRASAVDTESTDLLPPRPPGDVTSQSTSGMDHFQQNEPKPYLAKQSSSKSNDDGQDVPGPSGDLKYPIQESNVEEDAEMNSGLSGEDQHAMLIKKTQCATCPISLKDSQVVLNQPCGHMKCKKCALDQLKKCCDEPVSYQLDIFWT